MRNADEFPASCPQGLSLVETLNITEEVRSLNYELPEKNEDCLYLNVYTPQRITYHRMDHGIADSGIKLPVVIWIHGGGFYFGKASEYDGGMFASINNMVVVTINYRLGILGFFNVPGTNIKGNYGMLDQIGAMKWVKENIKHFGGDPHQITIFGESAGASSVSLHLLSPLSNGLFIRAISQSGVSVGRGAFFKVEDATDADNFSKDLGCGDNAEKSLQCLKLIPVKDILKQQQAYFRSVVNRVLMVPTVDGNFLMDDIRQKIKKKTLEVPPIPYMIGFNLNEGTLFVPPRPQNKSTFEALIKRQTSRLQNAEIITALINFEYTNWRANKNPLQWTASYAEFQGDDIFKVPSVQLADYWASAGGASYFYKFTHRPANLRIPSAGVAHTTDIDFVFGKPFYPKDHVGYVGVVVNSKIGYTEKDKEVSKNVMTSWANFARYGDPGIRWPIYTTSKKFLNIGSKIKVEKHPVEPKRMAFWNALIPSVSKIVPLCETRSKHKGCRFPNCIYEDCEDCFAYDI